MPGEFAPRFAIEAGFLILLGVGAGLADLRTTVIVILLAGAWVLVSLIELAAWRAQARPVGPAILPAPRPQADADADAGVGSQSAEEAVEPDDTAYPLRADAGSAPSEEVEAYTRVLAAEPADEGQSGRPEQET
jgi:hypothetical protein